MSSLKTLVRRVRESGVIYTIQILLKEYVPDKIWQGQKVSIWAYRLSKKDERTSYAANIRWADTNDIELLMRAGYSEISLKSRFTASCRAAILEDNNQLIAISWYHPSSRDPWEDHSLRLDLPENGRWNFDVWVSPDHRGKGIARQIMSFAHSMFHKSGVSYIYCSIDNLNKNSIRVFSKAGYFKVGEFFIVSVLKFAYFKTEKYSEFCRLKNNKKFFVPLHHEAA